MTTFKMIAIITYHFAAQPAITADPVQVSGGYPTEAHCVAAQAREFAWIQDQAYQARFDKNPQIAATAKTVKGVSAQLGCFPEIKQ